VFIIKYQEKYRSGIHHSGETVGFEGYFELDFKSEKI
jgi:hypothetical protein